MKICAAQLKPIAGDIERNVLRHRELIDLAVSHGADLIFFPELSLTGYEPKLAKKLATDLEDSRLNVFQSVSDEQHIIIGAGVPLSTAVGVQIGKIFFQPGKPRLAYSKQQLHSDELPFFASGKQQVVLNACGHFLAPAICYESLQPSHADNAAKIGADVYLASVAKSDGGVAKAYAHYPSIARTHSMTVLMANCLGPCDNFVGAGQSAIWNNRGELAGQMDTTQEGIVMIDMITQEVSVHKIPEASTPAP